MKKIKNQHIFNADNIQTRRDFIKTIGNYTMSLGFGLGMTKSLLANQEKPNIVIILTDDQGYADASFQLHPEEINTPNIDRIAANGIKMTNGYVNCSVCAPSRASLLTGQYSQRYGFYNADDSRVGLPVDETTIADLLQQEGYKTGMFGKWHCGLDVDKHHPINRGFDTFYGFLGHGGHDYFNLDYDPEGKHRSKIWDDFTVTAGETGYLTNILGDKAVEFIENSKDDPFFLYLPFNAVHAPLQALEEDIELFNTGNEERDIYLGMLYRLDKNIGKMLDKLQATDNYENTLIFFLSDNGGTDVADNMPLKGNKHSFYEGGIRVPFVVSWPGQLTPGSNDTPVIGMDIFQTICAVTGIDPPQDEGRDGKNMMPVLNGTSKDSLHEYLYWDRESGDWAIRNGKWKLHKDKHGKTMLIDLDNDISEEKNLKKKYPKIVKKLRKKYKAWRKEMPEKLNK